MSCGAGLQSSPQVSCTWSKTTAPNFGSYRLQRATPDGPFSPVFTTASAATTSFVDTGVVNGASYRYQLDVLDGSGAVVTSSAISTVGCCNVK